MTGTGPSNDVIPNSNSLTSNLILKANRHAVLGDGDRTDKVDDAHNIVVVVLASRGSSAHTKHMTYCYSFASVEEDLPSTTPWADKLRISLAIPASPGNCFA